MRVDSQALSHRLVRLKLLHNTKSAQGLRCFGRSCRRLKHLLFAMMVHVGPFHKAT